MSGKTIRSKAPKKSFKALYFSELFTKKGKSEQFTLLAFFPLLL